MPTFGAKAVWRGTSREGQGTVAFGNFAGGYSYGSRWEGQRGTNPEELLGAAHAACFSMSLAARLARAGHKPVVIETHAQVLLLPGPEFRIEQIVLRVEAEVPDATAEQFAALADDAKKNCPISKALAAVADIQLDARLVHSNTPATLPGEGG